MVFGIGSDIPLERQIDTVVHGPYVEPLFEIAGVPVDRSASEDLCKVSSLSRLKVTAQGRKGHPIRARKVLKILAGRTEVELPVVKLFGYLRRHRTGPRSQACKQFAFLFTQADELTPQCNAAIVNAKSPGKVLATIVIPIDYHLGSREMASARSDRDFALTICGLAIS